MSCGGDEVEAAVDTSVGDALLPGDVHLFLQEFLILLIDVFLNGLPAEGWEKTDGIHQKVKAQECLLGSFRSQSPHILPSLLYLNFPMDG